MSDWQPIETAPKDGTPIIGLTPIDNYSGGIIGIQWVKEYVKVFDEHKITLGGFWARSCHTQVVENPTHWMPLPNPPQE